MSTERSDADVVTRKKSRIQMNILFQEKHILGLIKEASKRENVSANQWVINAIVLALEKDLVAESTEKTPQDQVKEIKRMLDKLVFEQKP